MICQFLNNSMELSENVKNVDTYVIYDLHLKSPSLLNAWGTLFKNWILVVWFLYDRQNENNIALKSLVKYLNDFVRRRRGQNKFTLYVFFLFVYLYKLNHEKIKRKYNKKVLKKTIRGRKLNKKKKSNNDK